VLAVENQILNGTGVAPQLPGLWYTAGVLAVAFDTDAITTLRMAVTALQNNQATPTGIVRRTEWHSVIQSISMLYYYRQGYLSVV
jgi:hypothetical protein